MRNVATFARCEIRTCFYKLKGRFDTTTVLPFTNMDGKRTLIVLAFCLLILGTLTGSDPDPKKRGKLHSSIKVLKTAKKRLKKIHHRLQDYINVGHKIELGPLLPILSAITLFALNH
ncbi:uncharacterized protein [Macrobrachium rosenbergii]|uniref:uncharacterized protein isoform X2 n=1 Tax=Macrobrachium rosenbergii TaxID=79674 RepID=UPI0034D3CBB5